MNKQLFAGVVIGMSNNLIVGSWVKVRNGCPLSCRVVGDEVEFRYGNTRDGFDFVMEPEALREWLRQGADALRKLDRAAERQFDAAVL